MGQQRDRVLKEQWENGEQEPHSGLDMENMRDWGLKEHMRSKQGSGLKEEKGEHGGQDEQGLG